MHETADRHPVSEPFFHAYDDDPFKPRCVHFDFHAECFVQSAVRFRRRKRASRHRLCCILDRPSRSPHRCWD
jgi:hypothetical protein